MREILFRGKTEKGKWIEGDLYQSRLKSVFMISYYTEHGNRMTEHIIFETVGQFTGLTDKNGKKIFEGDIVDYKEEYGEIAYDNEQAMFNVLFDTWCTDFDHIYPYELEVIGNIHDNPELLGGAANA